MNLRARVADQTFINFNYAYIDAQYDVYCDDSRDWTQVYGNTFTSCKLDPLTGNPDTSGAYSRAGGGMPWTPDNAMVISVEHIELNVLNRYDHCIIWSPRHTTTCSAVGTRSIRIPS